MGGASVVVIMVAYKDRRGRGDMEKDKFEELVPTPSSNQLDLGILLHPIYQPKLLTTVCGRQKWPKDVITQHEHGG